MLIRAALVAGSLMYSSVAVAQADQYEDVYQSHAIATYKQHRAAFLDDIRILYFAVGCKVFASEAAVLPLINAKGSILNAEARMIPIIDRSGEGLMRKAAQEGLARSKQPGACNYWRENPDALYQVRTEATAAFGH